ncbi:MAG: hypothetical protein V7636_532 [Actinomycetota bacterium]
MLLVLASVVSACSEGDSPIGAARKIVDDDDRFATSIEAGDALAHIGSILLRAGKDCADGCDALLSASAYAQVLAVRVLDCTAPGRFKLRRVMRSYLDDVERSRQKSATAVPTPPPPPRCG